MTETTIPIALLQAIAIRAYPVRPTDKSVIRLLELGFGRMKYGEYGESFMTITDAGKAALS